MKRDLAFPVLLFLLLLALALSAIDPSSTGGISATATAWLPPRILPGPCTPTPTQGWWAELPAPIPLPTLVLESPR